MEVGGFRQRLDAYRFAIALALAEKREPTAGNISRVNYINIGGLDPDRSLAAAVTLTRDDHDGRPYALIERLAESGIDRIKAHLDEGRSMRELLLQFPDAQSE